MRERLTKFPDRRVWDLSGHLLEQIVLDYAVTLLVAERNNSISVVIENVFELRENERTSTINPEDAQTVVPLLAYLHKPVSAVTAFQNGDLLIGFASGAEIAVSKDDQYESWNSFGSGEITGADMLCSPHPGAPW